MAPFKKADFYSGKPTSLPRFVYRRLAKALRDNPNGREAAISGALQELLQRDDPDMRKFKFVAPPYLRKELTADELAQFEAAIGAKREHAAKLRLVYPHVSDEFSLNADFLAAALDLSSGPQLARDAKFFTVGSCFARNIAEFLKVNAVAAKTFPMAEDLNSPISNAFMFHLMQMEPDTRTAALNTWIERLFAEQPLDQRDAILTRSNGMLTQLATDLAEADCVILTLGNVVDFFSQKPALGGPLIEHTFPKFLAMPGSEDINVRAGAAARLKKLGALLRLASYQEVVEAIDGCIAGIRSITGAPLIVTLSPVPVDSVIGLTGSNLKSAVEVDCVSKSRLRSAFDEISLRNEVGGQLFYFPSFEIVRWIAPMLPFANFGLDDAASRHVSSPILDAICDNFLNRFLQWRPVDAATTQIS